MDERKRLEAKAARGFQVERNCTFERALELAVSLVDELFATYQTTEEREQHLDRWLFSIDESAAAKGTLLQKKGDA